MAQTVAPGSFSGVIRTGGRILPAGGDERTVVAPAAGIVRLGRSFTEGMGIAKGERLGSVTSSGLPEGDIATRNKIAYETAKADFERAEKLMAERLMTEQDYLAAKSEYEKARLAYESVGGSKSVGGVGVSAPIAGYVKEVLAVEGDYVETGTPLMRITQNRNLQLRAELPEREIGKLDAVSSAKFRTSYSDRVYDISQLNGRKIAGGDCSVSGGGFIPVTFEFNNTGGLVSGCYAEIYLLTTPRENVISVPESALTEEHGVNYVYVKVDDEGYVKRQVKIGESDGERVEILSGLSAGENVVTEGAVHVRLASATAAIPAHTHNH